MSHHHTSKKALISSAAMLPFLIILFYYQTVKDGEPDNSTWNQLFTSFIWVLSGLGSIALACEDYDFLAHHDQWKDHLLPEGGPSLLQNVGCALNLVGTGGIVYNIFQNYMELSEKMLARPRSQALVLSTVGTLSLFPFIFVRFIHLLSSIFGTSRKFMDAIIHDEEPENRAPAPLCQGRVRLICGVHLFVLDAATALWFLKALDGNFFVTAMTAANIITLTGQEVAGHLNHLYNLHASLKKLKLCSPTQRGFVAFMSIGAGIAHAIPNILAYFAFRGNLTMQIWASISALPAMLLGASDAVQHVPTSLPAVPWPSVWMTRRSRAYEEPLTDAIPIASPASHINPV